MDFRVVVRPRPSHPRRPEDRPSPSSSRTPRPSWTEPAKRNKPRGGRQAAMIARRKAAISHRNGLEIAAGPGAMPPPRLIAGRTSAAAPGTAAGRADEVSLSLVSCRPAGPGSVADQSCRALRPTAAWPAGRAHAFAGATRRGRQLLDGGHHHHVALDQYVRAHSAPAPTTAATAALEERKGGSLAWGGRPHEFLVGNRSTRAIEYARTYNVRAGLQSVPRG